MDIVLQVYRQNRYWEEFWIWAGNLSCNFVQSEIHVFQTRTLRVATLVVSMGPCTCSSVCTLVMILDDVLRLLIQYHLYISKSRGFCGFVLIISFAMQALAALGASRGRHISVPLQVSVGFLWVLPSRQTWRTSTMYELERLYVPQMSEEDIYECNISCWKKIMHDKLG